MTLLHIVTESEEQACEISNYLLAKKLILEVFIQNDVTIKELDQDGKIITSTRSIIMGKTKSLLFNYIDQKLRKKYGEKMPLIYSMAIVNMDWEQTNRLITHTVSV